MAHSESRAAAAANEDLRAFAYSVSHEMKSPSNTLEMLLSEVTSQHGRTMPDDAKYLLDLSLDSVRRMQTRIEDVLEFTRFLGGEPDHQKVSLDGILDKVKRDLACDIAESGAAISVGQLGHVTGLSLIHI